MPTPPCSIPGCYNLVQARGWCSKHYTRWYNHGDPLTVLRRSPLPHSGSIRLPLRYVDPARQAMAWAGQIRFNAAMVKLCDNPVHVR